MAKKKKRTPKTNKKFSEKDYLKTRMRTLPIGDCYITSDFWQAGEANIFVCRQHPSGSVSVGVYMVDVFCTGIKDTLYYFSLSPEDFDGLRRKAIDRFGMEKISYEEAHNIIYGALEYASDCGIEPHMDFAYTQYILKPDDDEVPLIEYEFGKDGKPLLIGDSELQIDFYRRQMLKKLSPDEFEVLLVNPHPDPSDDYDEEDEYDDMEEDDLPAGPFNDGPVGPEVVAKKFKGLDLDRKALAIGLVGYLMSELTKDYSHLNGVITAINDAYELYRSKSPQAAEAYDKLADKLGLEISHLMLQMIAGVDDAEKQTQLMFAVLAFGGASEFANLLQSWELDEYFVNSDDDFSELKFRFRQQAIEDFNHYYEIADALSNDRKVDLGSNSIHWYPIGDKWKEGVRTSVPRARYETIPTDPYKYYTRKMRDVVTNEFKDEEDFMGLIFSFDRWVIQAMKFLKEETKHLSLQIFDAILWYSSNALLDGTLKHWAQPGSDTYFELRKCLTNCLNGYIRLLGVFDLHDYDSYIRQYTSLDEAMDRAKIDIIDLKPLLRALNLFKEGNNPYDEQDK